MLTLYEILWELRNEELSLRLKLLEIKPERNNKATLIDTLKEAYENEGLRCIWDSLTHLEQAAVAETAYHQELFYDQRRVKAKVGGLPAFYSPPENKRGRFYSDDLKYATRLHLFLFRSKYPPEYFIPQDLAERLREFVPEPEETKPAAVEEPPKEEGIGIRSTPHEAVVEVMALLRLAEGGDFRISNKTALPSSVGARHILSCLPVGDFYPPEVAFLPDKQSWSQEIGLIKPVAWSRLLINAKYIDVQSTKSKLTPKGIKALSAAPHAILRDLWRKWSSNTRYDEFNRIDVVKGQRSKGNPMTAKPPRRLAITNALLECPVGKWIDTTNFSNFMQAADHSFEVARDPFRLYFLEHQYGHLGYDGFGGWNILQHRYLLCLLFEYAATLGMLDVAYVHPEGAIDDLGGIWGADELEWLSRYDGLRAFRLNDLGAYCLGLTGDYVSSLPESTLELEIGTQRVIRRKGGSIDAAERLLLETWAEPVDADTWQLNANRARQAIERGQNANDFAAFLRSHDPQPLPQTVEGFLDAAERDGRAVRCCGEALLFECRDAETADQICSHKELVDLCHPCTNAHIAVLAPHAEKFRTVVRKLGLGVI